MLRLFKKFKADQSSRKKPSNEELRLAANMKPLDPNECAIILSRLKVASVGIIISDEIEEGVAVCHQ